MCGVAGAIGGAGEVPVRAMLAALAHRGPDDEGVYADEAARVCLGHRRLAIVDTSPAGHQPMADASGDIWLTYNGEIYNYKELAAELARAGHVFRSASDTEVIIEGYRAWGPAVFEKIDGMWALALYDRRARRVILSRDPAGMKPLYIARAGGTLLFASEIGALAAVRAERDIDRSAMRDYLAHGYIAGEATAYAGIASLRPGAALLVELPAGKEETLPPRPAARRAAPRSLADAETTFARLFRESVRATLQADVPVGIFLSGGIDSTLIAQEAHALGARLQAFTIGFADADFDESQVAAAAAARLGFPHTTRLLSPEDMADDLPAIFDAFGEPFADTSMLPTYYLAQTAREAGYKVALAGDGADELFGGYPTHYLPRITRYWRRLPRGADALLAQLAARLPERQTALGAKEKLARFLAGARLSYQEAHGVWKRVFTDADLAELLSADLPQAANPARAFDDLDALDPVEATMAVDFRTFLAADCLVKSDICAMRHGVEVRAPFLNRAIVDFARSLPPAWKARPLRTKILLRRVLARTLGAQARLPKRGFVPPLGRWLAGPLREPMRALLAEAAIAKVGFIEYTYVKRLMDEHERGGRDHTKKLWSLMSLSRFYGRL